MLISTVEEDEGLVKGQESTESSVDDSHDYQTASELFDLMAKRHNYPNHGKHLSLPKYYTKFADKQQPSLPLKI